jgi:hypothetical protein
MSCIELEKLGYDKESVGFLYLEKQNQNNLYIRSLDEVTSPDFTKQESPGRVVNQGRIASSVVLTVLQWRGALLCGSNSLVENEFNLFTAESQRSQRREKLKLLSRQ